MGWDAAPDSSLTVLYLDSESLTHLGRGRSGPFMTGWAGVDLYEVLWQSPRAVSAQQTGGDPKRALGREGKRNGERRRGLCANRPSALVVRHHPLPRSRRVPPPHSLRDSGMRPQAQTLAWPCLSWGPTPCLWPQEGRDPRATASPKPNKASPWSLLAFQPRHPLSSLIIKWPSGWRV